MPVAIPIDFFELLGRDEHLFCGQVTIPVAIGRREGVHFPVGEFPERDFLIPIHVQDRERAAGALEPGILRRLGGLAGPGEEQGRQRQQQLDIRL